MEHEGSVRSFKQEEGAEANYRRWKLLLNRNEQYKEFSVVVFGLCLVFSPKNDLRDQLLL